MMHWPGSNISFSQVREDPLIEISVIDKIYQKKQHPLKVLMIGSGGCTAISLVAKKEVDTVSIIDANPAQLELIKLRSTIVSFLTLPEQKILLGIDGSEQERIELWENKCFANFSESMIDYWQNHLAEIKFGVNRVGKFEELFRELADLCTKTFGYSPTTNPQQATNHPRCKSVLTLFLNGRNLHKHLGERQLIIQ